MLVVSALNEHHTYILLLPGKSKEICRICQAFLFLISQRLILVSLQSIIAYPIFKFCLTLLKTSPLMFGWTKQNIASPSKHNTIGLLIHNEKVRAMLNTRYNVYTYTFSYLTVKATSFQKKNINLD